MCSGNRDVLPSVDGVEFDDGGERDNVDEENKWRAVTAKSRSILGVRSSCRLFRRREDWPAPRADPGGMDSREASWMIASDRLGGVEGSPGLEDRGNRGVFSEEGPPTLMLDGFEEDEAGDDKVDDVMSAYRESSGQYIGS